MARLTTRAERSEEPGERSNPANRLAREPVRKPAGRARRADSVPLEELNCAFVLLSGSAAAEGTQILAAAGPCVLLSRIQPILTRLQLADHRPAPIVRRVSGRRPGCQSSGCC